VHLWGRGVGCSGSACLSRGSGALAVMAGTRKFWYDCIEDSPWFAANLVLVLVAKLALVGGERMTSEEILNSVQNWSLDEQLKLLEDLVAMIRQQQDSQPRYSVLEFEGIGHGTWRDVGGVDEFLKQERASWDEYSENIQRIQEEGLKKRKAKARHTGQEYHSIMELKGLGKELWQGIDVEKYIEEERNSWSLDRDQGQRGR
jgi:hypothetical protein